MQRYANYGGDSGVSAFEAGNGYIDVRFTSGAVYRYTSSIPGTYYIEEMKRLAFAGRGLNSYISKYVKTSYAVKLR